MSKKLFAYQIDAHEEADGVKSILDENHISWYETPGSRWGFSLPAIWIQQDDDFERAQQLFLQFQQQFAEQARQAYQAQTGYRPNAPLKQRLTYLIKHLYARKKVLPVFILGMAVIIYYFYAFFNLLLQPAK